MLSNDQLVAELEKGTCIVTANQRLARTLAAEFARSMQSRGLQAWPTPAILIWRAWLQRNWRQTHAGAEVLLSEAMCVALWDEIVAPDTVLDISGRLGRVARDAWKIQTEWQIPAAEVARFTHHEAARYADWVRRYQHRLAKNGWLDPVQLMTTLDGRGTAQTRVRLLGFYQLSPAQTALIERFSSAGWDIAAESRAPVASRREFFRAADSDQELLAAAHWAKARLETDSGQQLAVVVPDLRQRQASAERIFARVLDPGAMLPGTDDRYPAFHMSVGRPLSEQPMICDALLALTLIIGGLDSNALSRLLRSPFFSFSADNGACARLDARLRSQWFESASVANLRWFCNGVPELSKLGDALDAVASISPAQARMAPGRWATLFDGWMDALGWPGSRSPDSTELQTCSHWTGLLAELGRLELLDQPLTARQAQQQLMALARTTEFQPEREEAPVQVLGMLEAAGSQFDAVWIAGLDDQAFPPAPKTEPFIPAPLQREYDVAQATAENALRFAREQLTALCGSAPDIVMSWPDSADGEPRRPSPLLDEISPGALKAADQPGHEPHAGHAWAAGMIGAATEPMRDERAPRLARRDEVPGGSRIFQFQSQCPFKANAALRLFAEHVDEPRPGMSPRLRGNLAHHAMESIWTELKNRRTLAALPATQRAMLLERALDAAWAANRFETQFVPDGINAIERRRLAGLIEEMLDLDLAREDFEVIRQERRERVEIGGLGVHLQIDRVDRLADGREVIIDYKTGTVNRNDALGTRPENPQLAVYATAAQSGVAAVLYGRMAAGGSEYEGFVAEDGLVGSLKAFTGSGVASEDSTDWDSLRQAWRSRLDALAGSFADGDARVDPTRRACDYCRFTAACRIRQIVSPESPE